MSIPKPYTDKAIRSEIKRHIRLYPREQLDEALLRYIKNNFVPTLSVKKGDHLQANIDAVIGVVCGHFNMSLGEMAVKGRTSDICYPRQVMHYMLSTRTSMSLIAIGRLFDQDHTTVMASRNKIIERYKKNPTIRQDIDEINELLPKRQADNLLEDEPVAAPVVAKKAEKENRAPAEYSNHSPMGIADTLHQTQKSA